MRRWKIVFAVVIVVLITSNAFWAYAVLDQSVTAKYAGQVLDVQARAIERPGRPIVQDSGSHSRQDVLFLLRQADPDAFIVDDGQTIGYEGISFRLDGDRLVMVGLE